MTDKLEIEIEIEKNHRLFLQRLPALIKIHPGRYALLRKEEIIGIYDTVRDAQTTGGSFFGDGLFSIQKIETKAINLGFYSHAVCLVAT